MTADGFGNLPLDDVPVFPLPGVVLLPEQRLPLHIFEPRYRAMVRDALQGHGHLVVAAIEAAPDSGPAPFAAIATIGKIVAHQKLPDGRFNILVEGVVRVALDELPFLPPYRRVRAELLGDPATDSLELLPALRAGLLSVAAQVIHVARSQQARFDFDAPTELPSPRLALRLVDRFVTSPLWRQRVLEAATPVERVAIATEALADVLVEGGAYQVSGTA